MDEPMRLLLGKSLSLSALIAATIQYAELAKRRAEQRIVRAEMADVQEAGLRGLVPGVAGRRALRAHPADGTPSAKDSGMSDARQGPIPQDRVNENVDQRELAQTAKEEQRQQERYLKDQGVDERPGTNPKEQPGILDGGAGPAEGGD